GNAAENQTNTAQGGYLFVSTTPRLSTATAERLRVMPEGELVVRGFSGTTTIAAVDLASRSDVGLYVKGTKLVFAFNNAGTLTYLTYPLDGTGTGSWTQTTTAP